jgi:conjugal transfer mating pair stabilization protein TraN
MGEHLGAQCNSEEKILNELRIKNLCVYAGKKDSHKLNVKTVVKHYFCCFNNILEKVIQEEGRKQLYPHRIHNKTLFGTGERPDCRGLTLDEIKRIDFSILDYSEVAGDIIKKLVLPNISDIEGRVRGSLGNDMKKFDESKPALENNKKAGTNPKTIGRYDD